MSIPVDLSIILVNYNVKDFLTQCINSIYHSNTKLNYEIIVVDNNSSDGSVEYLINYFPAVKVIPLTQNLGFGRANNIGMKSAQGRYFLLLNPDTIIQEDTLQNMFDYMEANPEVGISGCKILNPDGSLQLAGRRAFPTPWVAFTKLFGIQKLFPKSRIFGKYNLTYLDPDEPAFVDAISGSFMFLRREVFYSTNGFDPDFFMYGEDLDLCFRASKLGWKIGYNPSTSIIHFKGQSTKRSNFDHTFHFFKSMEIFTKKHFSRNFLFIFSIKFGIGIRQFIFKLAKFKVEILFMLFDLLVINLALILATWFRFGSPFAFPDYAYPTIFIAVSLVLIASMIVVGEYFEGGVHFWRSSFALLSAFFVLSSLTYFFKQFAFSRGILLLTISISFVFILVSRLIYKLKSNVVGKQSPRRLAFVGCTESTKALVESIEKSDTIKAQLIGIILPETTNCDKINLPYLGGLVELPEIVQKNHINEIVVTDNKILKSEIFRHLQSLTQMNVRIRFAEVFDDILAESIIDEISGGGSFPRFKLASFRYRLGKRILDFLLSLFFLTFGFPFLRLVFPRNKVNFITLLKVLIGKMTFVGNDVGYREILNKNPIVTITEANFNNVLSERTKEKLNQFYLQHYSPWLDLEILYRFFKGGK